MRSTKYRQLRPRTVVSLESAQTELAAEQVAAYLRQSSDFQVLNNTESADMQLTGALRYAVSQGLNADKIVIAHEGGGKRGVSGTLRIDQREKLQELVLGIKDGTIKVIWAYSVSRLFRDKYGVQVAVFIELCAEQGVKVIIENAKTFDFSNSFDVMMFQFLANVAAKENDDRSRLMNGAKHNKGLRGEYDGRPLTPGFIVDRDKSSKTYGKYLEYVPHAEVARKLYARFRQLGGQFNVLANEVAAMPLVFPDFEEWVSPRNTLWLKKVPGGYHISHDALFHLLTAIEYVGYWKVDGSLLVGPDGAPVANHAAIVPFADWEYAFTHLSFETLDGLPNQERTHGATWTPVTKQESEGLLRGILTSPLGLVNCSAGRYRVAEQRPNHPQRSYTLMVDQPFVDDLFKARLAERMDEIDREKFFYELKQHLQQRHIKTLVTVDEQIAGYYKQREGIQAFIKAVGATADIATLQQYNADLLEISDHISELETLKQSAQAEESHLARIQENLARMRTVEDYLYSKSFIKLACDTISLDRYSAHFLTLTIVWDDPFYQVDTCYLYRAAGVHQQWSKQDEADLIRLYPLADRADLYRRFPTRTWQSLTQLAYEMGISRSTSLNTSGITDPTLSPADWELFQRYGWEIPTAPSAAYWLYDIGNDTFRVSPKPERCCF